MSWVSIFILVGVLIRKLNFPIRLSVVPLLLLFALSLLRMLVSIELPGSVILESEVIYPAIVNFARFEIIPHRILGIPVNPLSLFIFLWLVGAVILSIIRIMVFAEVYGFIKYGVADMPREVHAESIVKELIGANNRIRVYKMSATPVPIVWGFRPYIILPDIDFEPDELRVILAHEVKHCLDRDNIIKFTMGIFLSIFWWNPLFYVFRQNISFAQELKCDYFAITNSDDLNHFESALRRMEETFYNRRKEHISACFNALVSDEDEINDRLKILDIRHNKSHSKSQLVNWGVSVFVVVMFFVSYMFAVLPLHRDSPDVPVLVDSFDNLVEVYHYEDGGIFSATENFVVDNDDGTFSLYIDGQYIMSVDSLPDGFEFFPMR